MEECCRGCWKQLPRQRGQEEGGSRRRGLDDVFEDERACRRSRRLRK